MKDENTSDKALNEEVEEENNQDSTPEPKEEATEEAEEAKAESTEEVEEESEETGGKKGYSKRVQELANKAKKAEEKAKSLEERLSELTGQDSPAEIPQYKPKFEPGSEVTLDDLQKEVANLADSRVSLKIRQYEAINRINNESAEAVRKYPELDPDSDEFNPELSEAVTEATENYVKSNPYSASVKDFVTKLMKPYKGAVTKEVGKATEQIAKDVSKAALKPTSIRKGEKSADEKSIEELEKELGVVQS